jgi:Tol biopolymer transport system component
MMGHVTRRQRIDDLTALAIPDEPALAPDGSEIVYVLRTTDAGADRNVRSLWRVGTTSGASSQLTQGRADFSPAWSPDGTRVAFLRGTDGPAQVWLLPMDGGEPEQLTTLPLGAGTPAWSPDGTKIAFAAPVDRQAVPGEESQDRARRTTGPVVTDRLDYRADGFGLFGGKRHHLHVFDVQTRQGRQVTDGDWHASDPTWSPDSARLAFSAAIGPGRRSRTGRPGRRDVRLGHLDRRRHRAARRRPDRLRGWPRGPAAGPPRRRPGHEPGRCA